MCPVVAVHNKLMCAGYASQIIGVIELLGDVLTEAIASTTRRDAPTAALIWIRP